MEKEAIKKQAILPRVDGIQRDLQKIKKHSKSKLQGD